jgi:hypothetical protein
VIEPPSATVSVHGLPSLGGRYAAAVPSGTGIENVHDCVPVKLEPSTQSDDWAPAVPGSSNAGPPPKPAWTWASISLSYASCTSVIASVAMRGPVGLVNATAGLEVRAPNAV